MQIVLHVSGYYDWEPVPNDVEVTEDDVRAGRVKPAQNGSWLVKVEKTAPTETMINIPESELQEAAVAEMTRGDRQALTREQLAHRYVTRYHLDHNTHPDWIQDVEVHDDGPDEAGFRKLLDQHVNAAHKRIQPRDVERMVAKYLEPSSHESHAAHLRSAYGVTPERVEAERARRRQLRETEMAKREAHAKSVSDAAAPKDEGATNRILKKKGAE